MKRKKLKKQVSGNGNQRSFKGVISNKSYGFTLIRSKALFYSYFLKAARLSEDGNAEYYEQAILCGYLSEDYEFIRQVIEEAETLNMMTASSLLIEYSK